MSLFAQVTHCQKRWAADYIGVASEELMPNEVSLVGIGGESLRPRLRPRALLAT